MKLDYPSLEHTTQVLNRSFAPARHLLQLALVGVDLLLLHCAVIIAFRLVPEATQNPVHWEAYLHGWPVGTLILVSLFSLLELYNLQEPFWGMNFATRLGKGLFYSFMLFIGFLFFDRTLAQLTFHFPRSIALISLAIGFLLLLAWRNLFFRVPQKTFRHRRILGLGKCSELQKYCQFLNHCGQLNYTLAVVLGENATLQELEDSCRSNRFDEVVDLTRHLDIEKVWLLLLKWCPHPWMVLKFIPTREEMVSGLFAPSLVAEIPLQEVPLYPIHGWNSIFKRLLDIFGSLLGLMVFAIPMILTAIGVKWDSPGPIFYHQTRVGRFGREFTVWKFRSMPENAEMGTGPVIASFEDKRCSRFGTFIRRWALDELPQLFVVLRGDMSLVGPRPERPFFIEKNALLGGRRLSVKPGLTGLAQVNSRFYLNLTDKLRYDLFYLNNYSLLLDLKICLWTIHVLWCETGVPAVPIALMTQDPHAPLEEQKLS